MFQLCLSLSPGGGSFNIRVDVIIMCLKIESKATPPLERQKLSRSVLPNVTLAHGCRGDHVTLQSNHSQMTEDLHGLPHSALPQAPHNLFIDLVGLPNLTGHIYIGLYHATSSGGTSGSWQLL